MWTSLPNEILVQILTILPSRSSLVVTALVCKRWRDVAVPLLWADIHVAIDASSPQFTDTIKFRNSLQTSVATAEYIKIFSVNFNVPPTSKQNPPDAERVSSYLTDIRGILLAAINLRVVKIRLPQSLF